jgi:hypothetical protein
LCFHHQAVDSTDDKELGSLRFTNSAFVSDLRICLTSHQFWMKWKLNSEQSKDAVTLLKSKLHVELSECSQWWFLLVFHLWVISYQCPAVVSEYARASYSLISLVYSP